MPQSDFTFVDAWQSMSPQDIDAVCAFWLREHANVEGHEATRRAGEVVTRVLDADGTLVAVSTVEPRTIPRLRQPMFYYRCFVGAAWRNHKLPRSLLRHGFDVLERWSRARDFPCIGVLLELENEGFARTLRRAWWPDNNFVYIGTSARGLDLRVRYFRGARLKPMD